MIDEARRAELQGIEDDWGRYDQVDATVQKWLLGYPGVGYSPSSGIFVPVATPLFHFVTRLTSTRNENMT